MPTRHAHTNRSRAVEVGGEGAFKNELACVLQKRTGRRLNGPKALSKALSKSEGGWKVSKRIS